MSRGLTSTNAAKVQAGHVHEINFAKLEFDDPVYVHNGVGNLTFGGNTYVGVGHFGFITAAREGSELAAHSLVLSLSGVENQHIAYAVDAGKYGDKVTIYEGYRDTNGTLAADPWIVWSGFFEYAGANLGRDNVVSITCQHDLANIEEKDGGRYSDEDQQNRHTGDVGFEFTAYMADTRLLWGGGPLPPTDARPTAPGYDIP